MLRLALATAGWCALVACSDIGSEDLLTSGIYADITVTADGTGSSHVGAVLRAGGPRSSTYVELTGDDALTATHQGQSRTLRALSLGTVHTYSATFSSAAPDVDFIVALERTVDVSASDTVIQLPDPFELEAPSAAELSRASDALTVSWAPAGSSDALRLVVDGDCVDFHSVDITGDPGTHTVDAGTLASSSATETTCEATVRVERRRGGVLDAGYGEGGGARGVQSRSATFSTAP